MFGKEKIKVLLFFLSGIFFVPVSCSKDNIDLSRIPQGAQLINNKYAENFSIYRLKDLSYIITTSSKKGGEGGFYTIPAQGFYKKNIYMACPSAMSLWASANNQEDKVKAIEQIKFTSTRKEDWYLDYVQKAFNQEKIQYAGKYNNPDFEKLLSSQIKLAVESTMITHAPKIKEKLESLGIEVFVDKSSYETNPLGRLEWIKVYGLLQGNFEEACLAFEKEIASLEKSIDNVNFKDTKSVVFFSVNLNGTVLFRQKGDYIDNMISIAGGKCLFPKMKKTNSAFSNISFEEFYVLAKNADFLIYQGSINAPLKSIEELTSKNILFKEFNAVKNKNVWRTGSAFYQSTAQTVKIIKELKEIFASKKDFSLDTVYWEKVN